MSARLRSSSSVLYLNSTREDSESGDFAYEFQSFNISMLFLSVCVLTATAVACCISYLNRWRHRKRVCKYERAVACILEEEPVDLKVVQRSESLRKTLVPFWPSESPGKDESSGYYIHPNPLPVRCGDDIDPSHTDDGR